MEAGFIVHQRDLLVHRSKALCYISLGLCVFTLMYNFIVLKQHQRETFLSDMGYESTKISLFCLIVMAMIIGLLLAVLHLNLLMAKLRPAFIEIVCIGVMLLVMVVTVLRPPEIVTRMRGGSVKEAFGAKYFSDSAMVLSIDGIITAAHLGFPVRWCSMFPLEVAGLVLYSLLVFVIGSNEPIDSNMWSLGSLIGLTLAAALGKRANEMGERQHFLEIINERSLRCTAEYQLSRTSRRERQSTPEHLEESPGKSYSDSVPCTTAGSQVFDLTIQRNSNVPERLTRVKELGDTEHWCINEAEVKLLPDKVLGSGGFGQVVMATFCGVMVAVKFPRSRLEDSDLPRLPELCNELRVLRHVRHANIAAIQGAIVAPHSCNVALVIELVKGLVLDLFLLGKQPGVPARYTLMLGVCNALLYLHTRCPHIVHGDIKGSNIMVETLVGAVRAKLLDFGLSRVLTRNARPLGGTLAYAAPEVVKRDRPVKCSADIYSFGRLITFIATGTPPLCNMTKAQIKRAMRRGTPPAPFWPQRCAFKPGCLELVRACVRAEERERPDVSELHAKLLALPSELDLTQGERQTLEDAHALAAQLKETAVRAGAGRAGEAEAAARARPEVEAEDVHAVAAQPKEPADGAGAEEAQPEKEAEGGSAAAAQMQLSL